MQKIKLFDVDKGLRVLNISDGTRITRSKIVRYLRGTPYMWDASTFKRHIEGNKLLASVLDVDGSFINLLHDIPHPIIAYNMTCALEAEIVLKSMFKLNVDFSIIAAESVYGNVVIMDIMSLPEDMLELIQPDIIDYPTILKKVQNDNKH